MKQFRSIEKIDTAILYILELTSSISVLLLAFGLIASMVNVLTKGSILTNNLSMQELWAWTQCIAIDASVPGMVIRTFQYKTQQEYIKCALNGLLSLLLLFTAAIVSNIESVQQTLSLTLEAAYIHVFVPVEVLIWVRSLAIVLLIVAHALRHVHQGIDSSSEQTSKSKHAPQTLDPELLRTALSQTTVSEEERCLQELPAPDGEQEREQGANIAQEASEEDKHDEKVYQDEQEANNFERVKTYLTDFPGSTDREIAHALSISASTANKWRKRVLREND